MDPFLQAMADLPTLLIRIQVLLEANLRTLHVLSEHIGKTKLSESDAAEYLGVEPTTMYHYRLKGLPYEKVGRTVSYLREDLDTWREAGRVRKHNVVR